MKNTSNGLADELAKRKAVKSATECRTRKTKMKNELWDWMERYAVYFPGEAVHEFHKIIQ